MNPLEYMILLGGFCSPESNVFIIHECVGFQNTKISQRLTFSFIRLPKIVYKITKHIDCTPRFSLVDNININRFRVFNISIPTDIQKVLVNMYYNAKGKHLITILYFSTKYLPNLYFNISHLKSFIVFCYKCTFKILKQTVQ